MYQNRINSSILSNCCKLKTLWFLMEGYKVKEQSMSLIKQCSSEREIIHRVVLFRLYTKCKWDVESYFKPVEFKNECKNNPKIILKTLNGMVCFPWDEIRIWIPQIVSIIDYPETNSSLYIRSNLFAFMGEGCLEL